MAGDFNMKDVNWNNLNCGIINGLNGYQVNSLMKFMNHFFLQQLINIPTRESNILDLVLSNNTQLFTGHETVKNKQFSDHNSIISHLNIRIGEHNISNDCSDIYDTEVPKYKLTKDDEDWESFEDHLNMNKWSKLMDDGVYSIEQKMTILYNHIEESIKNTFEMK